MVERLLQLSFLYFLFLNLSETSAQQKIRFRKLSVEQGLSQNSVLSIAQGSDGLMWFGTKYGLNKYDTYKMKVYLGRKEDSTSLSSSDYIRSLFCDSKKAIWVGSSRGLNKFNASTDSFEQITPNPQKKHSISNEVINEVLEDKTGKIWVATKKGLNLLINRENLLFQRFFENETIYTLEVDNRGNVWVATSSGLVKFILKGNKYRTVESKKLNAFLNLFNENHAATLCADDNFLWIGTNKAGLIKYNTANDTYVVYSNNLTSSNRLSSNNVRKVLLAKDGKIWVGTQNGINIIDPITNKVSVFQYDVNDVYSLSQNSVYDIYQDKQGTIWIGTYYGGVNYVYEEKKYFDVHKSNPVKNSISSNIISAISQDNKGNLWIGTEAEGLNYYNTKTKTFKNFKNSTSTTNSLSSNLVKTIFVDNQKIWIGTHLGGLDCFNSEKQTFTHFKANSGGKERSQSGNANIILKDSKTRFWVGTGNGLKLFDEKSGKFSFFEPNLKENVALKKAVVQYIYEDSKQNIWVATVGTLYLLKSNTNRFVAYHAENNNNLASSTINCITEDSRGNIWLGSYHGGLNLYLPQQNKFLAFTIDDGLAGNNVLGILEEKKGILWISTNGGLSRFDTENKAFRNYDINDGLPGNVFNSQSFFKDANGTMYFGGFDGLVSFRPSEIKVNTYSPKVIFTDVKLFNQSLAPNSPELITYNQDRKKQIKLEYAQNVVTIEYANLNYITPQKNSYSYYLEGFEKGWNYSKQPSVTYTNLSEGKYVLHVKGRNNDGVWSGASQLIILVKPPLWRTWWAYLGYLILFGLIFFGVMRFLLIRGLLRREKKVHKMKLDFFTNISHEIRTPLTLITSPLEKMLDNPDSPVKLKQLQSIKDNADRLLKLVTELLDFRKVETGNLSLNVTEEDIVTFSQNMFAYCEDNAAMRHISYNFSAPKSPIKMYFDKVQLEKVFFNLLSNALKFVPDYGEISLVLIEREEFVDILLRDNGPGIPKKHQHMLFNTFYQVSPDKMGSGIGLALCKNIIDMHKGTISVESEIGSPNLKSYTCIKVSLKKGKDHFEEKVLKKLPYLESTPLSYDQIEDFALESDATQKKSKKPTILVVEDNTEMRSFICESLEEHYTVFSYDNGLSGLDAGLNLIPDLIVSDVMMAGLDGVALCSSIKTDTRTDHIPVILLTAQTDHSHQLSGTQAGADLYMLKPFSIKLLQGSIKNLLASREIMRQKFSKIVTLEPTHQTINSPEEAFLSKLMNLIEQGISEKEFNVPILSDQMGMSQPVLYKKVRALTDLSVNDFIKSVRLKKAASLLKHKIYNVSEIAYMVGFSDPKYFTKEFRKQFKKSPTDYLKEGD